jgi:hypothetical protein
VAVAVGGVVRVRVGSAVGRGRRVAVAAAGLALALAVGLAAGELYLRVTPPGDLAQYLGAAGPQAGPFRPDVRYGAQYRSLDALAADNPGRLDPFRAIVGHPSPPRVWAFFGSSFAQAPGMLADTAREHVPQRTTFHLGKNEIVPVRLAQAEFLLDAGLPVERVIVVVIPLDGYQFALHGLDQIRVTAGGGLAYEPRLPAVGAGLLRESRLLLKGWTRTGLHLNRPGYAVRQLNTRFDGPPLADFAAAFGHLADALARHRVPATVLLLPNHEQVTRGAGWAFQDAVAPALRGQGYDVCDVREPFLAYPDKPALFIPDKHFSPAGNRLLLAALLRHLKATDPRSADLPDPDAVLRL